MNLQDAYSLLLDGKPYQSQKVHRKFLENNKNNNNNNNDNKRQHNVTWTVSKEASQGTPKIRITGKITLTAQTFTSQFMAGKSINEKFHVVYWAPSPAPQQYSVYGSKLPFANPAMAYSETNRGVIPVDNQGNFSFQIELPNSMYINNGSTYVRPHVNFQVNSKNDPFGKVETIYLDNATFPFRSLGYATSSMSVPERNGPEFYARHQETLKETFRRKNGRPRTQEEILTACRHPGITNSWPANFWGTCPPGP